MAAYYNEHDAFAAAWLRELIQAGHIALGEVDERDIQQVEPEDLKGFTQCHFFAGIGVWSYALRAAGWPDDSPVWTGSCPCQGFSASGKRGGFSDQRHLWPAWFRLIGECAPDVLFGEQVASKDGLAWFDVVSSDLEGAGYACGAADTCAAGFGAPHIRQRLYFVAHAQHAERRPFVQHRQAERNGDDAGRSEAHGELGARGEVLGMAHTPDPRRAQAGQHGSGPPPLSPRPEQCGGNGELGYSPFGGLGMRGSAPGESGRAAQPEQAGELGHSHQPRPQGQRELAGAGGSELPAGPPKFTNGFWSDAYWLWCRDQKYRPVEPGTFPLAHGAANRVGRLRGYGNALCSEQAKAFVEAYLEVRG